MDPSLPAGLRLGLLGLLLTGAVFFVAAGTLFASGQPRAAVLLGFGVAACLGFGASLYSAGVAEIRRLRGEIAATAPGVRRSHARWRART